MSPSVLPRPSLSLKPAIDSHFLTAEADTSLREVLEMMSKIRGSCLLMQSSFSNQRSDISDNLHLSNAFFDQEFIPNNQPITSSTSCVLVIDKSRLLGVFTERDIVKLTAAGTTLKDLTLRDVITQPAIAILKSEAQDVFSALSLFRQHKIRHLPIVDEQFKPVGLVTNESIRRAFQPMNLLTRLRCVRDVMTTKVIHAPSQMSVLNLAQLMTKHQVSCVVITEELEVKRTEDNRQSSNLQQVKPLGIVTERDIVQFQALELDLSGIEAQMVMSTPLFELRPEDSLWGAHQKMNQHRVRRLVVVGNEGELLGIISQTSLLQVLNPAEMYGVIDVLQQLVEERTTQLETTNQQLRHEITERKRAESALRIAHDQLKQKVEERTAQLSKANKQLKHDLKKRQRVEAALRKSELHLQTQTVQLQETLKTLQNAQLKLIQTEKMSSLGQLVAGIAHEINNPINFIYGNLAYADEYVQELLDLVQLYSKYYPQVVPEIKEKIEEIDLEFLKTDISKLLGSIKLGAERIRNLILSLRNFSRLDEAQLKTVDIHEGLESTLLILQNKLSPSPKRSQRIKVIKEYNNLPLVECYPGQLNQVFLHLFSNAIDALDSFESQKLAKPYNLQSPTISIRTNTGANDKSIVIKIADNGCGMKELIRQQLFDPFFTTKPVGQGTGLGLSISYQIIVEKHDGCLDCISKPGNGTEFTIEIPTTQAIVD